MNIFTDFVYNTSLILAATLVFILLPKKQLEPRGWARYLYGIGAALICMIIMTNPYVVQEGVQFDARSIVVAATSMFLGLIPSIIVTVIASVYRLIMGGDGAIVGVLVVIVSAIIGLAWRYLFYEKLCKDKRKRLLNIYLTGLVVHVSYVLLLVFLPNNLFFKVFLEVHISLLVVYPVGFTVIGLIMLLHYDRFESKKDLEEAHDTLFTYFEYAPYGIMITDADGKYMDVNKKALELSGYDLEELRKMTTYELASPDNDNNLMDTFPQLKNEGYIDVNKKISTKHMGTRTWNIRAVKLSDKKMVGFVHDITERLKLEKENRKLEATMRNQQKLESVGTLAGGVAHEINNPINGILNYGQLILDSPNDKKEIDEYATEIIYESNRIADIVKSLLAFSRQDSGEMSSSNIEEMIRHTVALINTIIKGDQISLDIIIEKNLPLVRCRGQQIQQVIMNLLTNSRDALNEKYPGYDDNKIMKITCSSEYVNGNNMVKVSVYDSGNGISGDIAENIFDPFFTTKERNVGTGLGLAISYGIIKDHEGEIGYTTKEGEFTEFFVLLPADEE